MSFLLFLLACNDCDYFEQCDGNTLLVCGASVDQLYNRKVTEVPCEGDNPVCVAIDDKYATCAVSADACDLEAPGTCDGDVLTICQDLGYDTIDGDSTEGSALVAVDCAENGMACVTDDSGIVGCS